MIARTRRAVRARPAVHPLTFADDVRPWTIATVVVVGGYLLFQRPFAYLGVPGTPLFVGEMLLGAFYLLRSDVAGHRLMRALLTPDRLGAMAWGVFLVALYGATLVIRGDNANYPRRLLLQEFVFNLYPLYLFLGLWLAERDPKLLERFMIGVAWATGIYGAIYLPFLNNSIATIPGTTILLFRAPLGTGAAIIALLAFKVRGWRLWVPLLLNLLVLLGVQNRAAYAGFVVGLVVWAVMAKRVGRVAAIGAVLTAVLAVAWVLDLRLELSRGASEYSARNIVAAVVAPFDEEAASRYSEDARNFSGTTEWRKTWWAGIWDAVHADPVHTAFGSGYGFELTSTADLRSSDPDLRTPHNWFMYAIGYGGWTHVLVFVFLLSAVSLLLWEAFRRTGVAFGLPFLALSTTVATFSNFYETPYAAIPVWVLCGMAIAPVTRGAEP
jgi:hypothetical protein